MFLLGFDIGTSSIKATLMDVETQNVIISATAPAKEMEIISHQVGWAEQHPQMWWDNVKAATAQILSEVRIDVGDIETIGITYQMHGLVIVDKDLEPGDFERIYAALPTIEFIFEKGMKPIDPPIMENVVQSIHEKRPDFDIKIDSISARELAPSIKFTVKYEEHKEPALTEVKKVYEVRLKQLESERDRYWKEIQHALDKPRKVELITAGPGAVVATDGSAINIQQYIHHALEVQKAIAEEPEESKSFTRVAKKTALDIIGESIKDIAKGQIKEAAKQIIELGKDLGPIIVKTTAYAFFNKI